MKASSQRWIVNSLLWVGAGVTIFPLLWMLSVSLMPTGASSNFPPPILPSHLSFSHYRELFAAQHLARYALNSLIVAGSATALALLVCSMAGYSFAKLRFRGRDATFRLLLACLLIPAQVTMIPLFGMLKFMGLINSYSGAILPSIASIFGIFIVRQYALSIPDELLDAARIDGASEWRIFRSVVAPLLTPIVITLGVFVFLGTWNDFMWPLIVLTERDMQTLPVALAGLSLERVQDNELMMAGATITILPVLVLFLALQRFYLRGIMLGSIKG
jgi:multiple sugar transport system permease protein